AKRAEAEVDAKFHAFRHDCTQTPDLTDIALNRSLRIAVLDRAVDIGDFPRAIPLQGDVVMWKPACNHRDLGGEGLLVTRPDLFQVARLWKALLRQNDVHQRQRNLEAHMFWQHASLAKRFEHEIGVHCVGRKSQTPAGIAEADDGDTGLDLELP